MGNNHLVIDTYLYTNLIYFLKNGELPKSLSSLKNLQRIVLHQNNLQGSVPDTLGDLGCIVNLAGNPLLKHGPDVPHRFTFHYKIVVNNIIIIPSVKERLCVISIFPQKDIDGFQKQIGHLRRPQ